MGSSLTIRADGQGVDERKGRIEISLQNPNGYSEAGARQIRPWLERLVDEVAPEKGSLGVRFMSDRAMRALNRRYRGLDRTTDVLSFPGDRVTKGGYIGDIAISVPAARRQAAAAGQEVRHELQVLLLHGLLHCLGYDHESDDGAMRRIERKLRRSWIGLDV